MDENTVGTPQLGLWRFANAELDERTYELRVGGTTVDVPRAALRVLLLLLERPGQPVSREQFIEKIWRRPEHLISKTVVSNAVLKLRRALNDDSARLIVTVEGGYRLDATVERSNVAPSPSIESALQIGQSVTGRPNWLLKERIDAGAAGEVWRVEHAKTGEVRVFKFAVDGFQLSGLKREVTISRLITEALGERPEFVPIRDWNFEQLPFFIESDFGGVDLIRWADQQGGLARIPLDDRIRLAIQLADAVSLAHSIGILHKDLKPANVLRGDDGIVRLVDFGSGWLLEPDLLADYGITRLATETERGGGTPFYIAPELLAGEPATASADVYALGVILYQLVVADFRKPIASGWESLIEDELVRADIAAATDGQPAQRLAAARDLADRLRSLSERRAERSREAELQRTAAAAKQQLERARLIRPWRVAAVVALLVGLVGTTVFAVTATRARSVAERQTKIAQSINAFINDTLMAQADSRKGGHPDITLRDALKAAAPIAATKFKDEPATEAGLRINFAQMFNNLSLYDDSITNLQRAIDLLQPVPKSAEVTNQIQTAKMRIGSLLTRKGKFDEAKAVLDGVEADGVSDPDLQLKLAKARGIVAAEQFRFEDAVKIDEAGLKIVSPATDPGVHLDIQENLVEAMIRTGHLDEARLQAERYVADATALKGPTSLPALRGRFFIPDIDKSQFKTEQALAEFRALHDDYVASLGPGRYESIQSKFRIAECLYDLGRFDDALKTQREVVTDFETLMGPDNTGTLYARMSLGNYLSKTGDAKAGVPLLEEGLVAMKTRFGVGASDTLAITMDVADAEINAGNLERAKALLKEIEINRGSGPASTEENPSQFAYETGRLAFAEHRYGDAKIAMTAAIQMAKADTPSGYWMLADARDVIARSHQAELAQAEKRR